MSAPTILRLLRYVLVRSREEMCLSWAGVARFATGSTAGAAPGGRSTTWCARRRWAGKRSRRGFSAGIARDRKENLFKRAVAAHARAKFGQRSVRDQPALCYDADLRAKLLSLIQQVRAEENGLAGCGIGANDLMQGARGERVKPAGWLVKDEQ